jgi:hypothetical protein
MAVTSEVTGGYLTTRKILSGTLPERARARAGKGTVRPANGGDSWTRRLLRNTTGGCTSGFRRKRIDARIEQ